MQILRMNFYSDDKYKNGKWYMYYPIDVDLTKIKDIHGTKYIDYPSYLSFEIIDVKYILLRHDENSLDEESCQMFYKEDEYDLALKDYEKNKKWIYEDNIYEIVTIN